MDRSKHLHTCHFLTGLPIPFSRLGLAKTIYILDYPLDRHPARVWQWRLCLNRILSGQAELRWTLWWQGKSNLECEGKQSELPYWASAVHIQLIEKLGQRGIQSHLLHIHQGRSGRLSPAGEVSQGERFGGGRPGGGIKEATRAKGIASSNKCPY